MNKTFMELYREEEQLEKGLAGIWGYQLSSTCLDNKHKKQKQAVAHNVASITLRKFGQQIMQTDRIKQVQDEIKALHNERKLMEEQQKAMQAAERGESIHLGENKIIKWMQNIVEEYNSILAHKHLRRQTNNEQNKNGPSQAEIFAEDLLRKIEEKRQLLLDSDLKTQIAVNREIAALYREYYKGKKKPNTALSYYKTRTLLPEPSRSRQQLKKNQSDNTILQVPFHKRARFASVREGQSDFQFMSMIENKNKNSEKQLPSKEVKTHQLLNKFKEGEYKKQYITSRNMIKVEPPSMQFAPKAVSVDNKKKGKGGVEKVILSPFVEKSEMSKFKQMEAKIKNSNDVLQIWRGKVSEVCITSRVSKDLQRQSRLREKEENKEVSEQERREKRLEEIIEQNVHIKDLETNREDEGVAKMFLTDVRDREQKKEDIFAQLLRKRNNKFNKLWGTRILVKYDSKTQARNMLRGQADKSPNKGKIDSGLVNRSSLDCERQSKMVNDGYSEQKLNRKVWLDEANDREHYQRTCKNQKINLLLKRR